MTAAVTPATADTTSASLSVVADVSLTLSAPTQANKKTMAIQPKMVTHSIFETVNKTTTQKITALPVMPALIAFAYLASIRIPTSILLSKYPVKNNKFNHTPSSSLH
jgi:hypothetical protein